MSSQKKKRFLVLDGNSLLHRAWHAIPPLTASDGRVVNAAYGFTNVIEKMRSEFEPDYFAVAWDLPGATFRHEAYEEYKGTREKKEDELYAQIDIIQEILDAYGIPSLSAEGFEADDVIGTLAKKYGPKIDTKVSILTGDLDALQLVDKDVEVITFVKGMSVTKTYDKEAVVERYGLTPDQLVDFKALMGDPSDNIPGLAGIGKKSAADLLQEFKTMKGIFDALKAGKVPSKWVKKLEGKEKAAEEMRHLVEIVTDVKLEGFRISDAKVEEPKVDVLIELFRDLQFRNLLKRYATDVSDVVVEEKPKAKKKKTSVAALADLVAEHLTIYIEEGPQDLFGGSIKSIALYDGKQLALIESPKKDQLAEVVKVIGRAELLIGHDLKRAFHTLGVGAYGHTPLRLFDTMVAAYLLDSSGRRFDLETLADTYLDQRLKEGAAAEELVEVVWKLAKRLEEELEELKELEVLARDVEMPLIPVLAEMEHAGIEVDQDYLKTLSDSFGKKLKSLTGKIYKAAGKEFNINSPSQLAVVLFDDLGLPTTKIKKTKTGYSTAASELEKLWDQHKIVPLMSEYREFAKLKSTYVDAFPELIAKDGRIHTTYNQTVAATGRLSSKDPNLQNIPIRTELGREIRKAFVAPKGKVLLAADYSQFELRIAAVIAKDETFLQAFKDGADIHKRTAAQVMEKDEEDVTKDERRAAKAINFGILYGMGVRNLARSTGMKREEAKAFLERYFDLHPGIRSYIDDTKEQAHEDEYIETLFGRRRWLLDINSGIGMLRAAAERMAVNMPVQGTQADLVKMAMLEVAAWISSSKLDVTMLLQVHDELVFEIASKDLDVAVPQIKKIMEGVWDADVPLIVDCEVGKNWGTLKSWK